MVKRLIVICIALLPLLAAAQGQKPKWCDAEDRRQMYPEDEYFVGYQSGFIRNGESLDEAVARIKTEAQGDAAQRIQVHIHSTTVDAVQSAQQQTAKGLDEDIVRLFRQQTNTTATLDIPNLQALTWNNPSTREVAAVVYTRRSDFVRFYDRQIESILGKMEVAIESALEYERQGSQIKGRTTAEDALRLGPQVEYAQRMVALADVNATLNDLQMSRYTSVVKQLSDIVARLRHATAFFIQCSATTIGDKKYPLLDKDVRGQLSAQGCHFTDDRLSADWIIEIDASVIETTHQEGMMYFSYVDGSITIYNGTTGKKLIDDRLSTLGDGVNYDGIKGGDISFERAARIAYRNAARIIAESILALVQE